MKNPAYYFKTNEMGNKSSVLVLLRAILVGIIAFILCALIFSALLSFTDLSDSLIPNAVQLIILFSVVVASVSASAGIKKKGWLTGIFMGTVFFILNIIISGINGVGMSIDMNLILKLLFYLISGVIGGMIGVNLGQKQ